jgi:putative chitinase
MIQTLLNLNVQRFPGPQRPALVVDGLIGSNTISRLRDFEAEVMRAPDADGLVTADDPTLRALRKEIPTALSEGKLAAIMPYAQASRVGRFYGPLTSAMPGYGIDTPLRVAHFIAQLAHESGSFRYTEELADGRAYDGRADLGNTTAGDGPRFKGRGLIQLTGRANYTVYSAATGQDYVAHPERLAQDPAVACDVACWFWKSRKLNALADLDDVKAVTKRINGGYNGLDDRIAFLGRAKCLLVL